MLMFLTIFVFRLNEHFKIAQPQTQIPNYPFGVSIIILKIPTTLYSTSTPVKHFRRKKFIAEPPLKILTPNFQGKVF